MKQLEPEPEPEPEHEPEPEPEVLFPCRPGMSTPC